jgi:hypothetical protein
MHVAAMSLRNAVGHSCTMLTRHSRLAYAICVRTVLTCACLGADLQ